jgi:salicylate hydroxylase
MSDSKVRKMGKRVLISGAGIGGLTAALCLLKKGYDVQVLEQAPDLKAVGAGIQLSANATRVLYGLGLEGPLTAATIVPSKKCVRIWNTGQEWQLFDLGRESLQRYGFPYMMLYRPDLHRILVDALCAVRPDALTLNAKVVKVEQREEGVSASLQDGTAVSGDLLIGADGVHSVTRAQWIAEDKPRFSGCIAWRGVIPVDRLPARFGEPAGVNWVGPGAHVIHYLVSAGRLVSFTGIVEKGGDWGRESWTEQGSVDECLHDFRGWHEDVQAIVRQLKNPLRWAMMVRDPLANWTQGRITLLGDAAHPTLPFLAQGAGMAIEDACVIARALERYADDPALALQVYQATRIERTTRIVNGSAANTKRFHNPQLADPDVAARYVADEWQESKVRQRYEWLFSYEPENVPLAMPVAA